MIKQLGSLTLVLSCLTLVGCSTRDAGSGIATAESSKSIMIDGSSTVYPISSAVTEEFKSSHPTVKVSVTGAGSSSGFKRLIAGDLDIADASRPIADQEVTALKDKGIDFLELHVAIDGLSVVVNKNNDWCSKLTVSQLKELWKSGSPISKWSQLDPAWPDVPIKLFGAGTNSGTFEYFTEAIVGKKGDSREDYNQSENDNQLVTGVAGDKYGLGYFGYSYFDENRDTLRVVKISASDDAPPVEPTKETIETGTYKPLSRPLLIYVKRASLERPEVQDFVKFYLSDQGQELVTQAHCIRMTADQLQKSRQLLTEALDATRP